MFGMNGEMELKFL